MQNYIKDGQLTVEQLIEKLKQQPPEAVVWHEGCDCWGAANGVVYDEKEKIVLITRIN
jgi:hypothetical protein